MEISQIKTQLTISQVLQHYGLKADRNGKMCCPFHEDKTPSMQVYEKTNTVFCFSSNCKTHGKSLDVIDFVLFMENCTKHEAILKCISIGNLHEIKNSSTSFQSKTYEQKTEQTEQTKFLTKLFSYFKNGLNSSKSAKEYLESRALNYKELEVGFNSGQFHYRENKTEELIENCLKFGLLIDKGLKGKNNEKAYQVFGKNCIVYPLKNADNEIVSFYFRSILTPTLSKGEGVSPPLEGLGGKHFYLKNRQGIYPNYPNVNTKKLILTESIIDCSSLLQVEEIVKNYSLIACFGTNGLNEEILKAIKSLKNLEEIIFAFDNDSAGKEAVKKYAKLLKTELQNIKITTLELPNKDVNEVLQLHTNELFIKLLDERKEVKTEEKSIEKSDENLQKSEENPQKTSEKIIINGDLLNFLTQKNLIKNLNDLIGKSGIVGEENSRMLLFLIVLSYLNKNPLHALVQGSSGSGKTHIISRIADLMPPEDVLRFTRITESSLYNWGEFDLFQKVIIIEDLDGLKEEALYALREFISNQVLRSSVTIKDKKGNNKSTKKEVKGQFSSLSATTKGETYEDNMNRSFVIAMNESEEQTQQIIDYQNLRIAGKINEQDEKQTILFIQKLVRNLKPYEVINPYAMKLQLPHNVKNKRRLNEMFQAIIKQITIVNQNQRKLTKDNKLITEIEDIENAVEILFDSILLKIDELDGSLRQFLEKIKKSFKDQDFNRFEAMEVTGLKKTQLQHYLNELVRYEYLK